MDILEKIRERARRKKLKIVLPESGDVRTLKSCEIILKEGTAIPVLIGEKKSIENLSSANQLSLSGVEIIEPASEKLLNDFKRIYLEKTRAKGVSEVEAYETVKKPLYFGSLLVESGYASGIVAGATHTTAETVRAYLRCFGPKPNIKTVSSFFLMVSPKKEFGEKGVLLYADCGIVANPNAEQLAEIAISSKESFELLVEKEARLAFLSFSTKGSAKDPSVDRIVKALEILKLRACDVIADGELQADAALVPEVGAKKAPSSKVAGRANILIFPDLNSGNIAYKITERMGSAIALGPILQGIGKPANDLSRGCKASDIADVVAITAVQAEGG